MSPPIDSISTDASTPSTWQLTFGLVAVTLIAQLVSLAFGRLDDTQVFTNIALPSALFIVIVSLPCCYLGIRLGRSMNFGISELDAVFSDHTGALTVLKNNVVLAATLGIVLGGLLLLLRLATTAYLPAELPQLGFRGAAGGFAVSIGAAVAEEVWFRLGFMTLLVWSYMKLTDRLQPSSEMIWGVIILAAIAFAAIHIPQLVAHGAASPVGIAGTILGNTIVGILFGWLYWQNGIVSAMVAHFCVDVMLHVVSVAIW